jgi:hypothetical protein
MIHRYGILVNPRQWLIYTFNEDTMPAWIMLLGESSNNTCIVLEKRGWSLWYRGREAVSLVHKYHWSIARHFATSQRIDEF